ncbi:MAG: fumarylacetoacetate hydrolase family protein [Psychromonas sp.]
MKNIYQQAAIHLLNNRKVGNKITPLAAELSPENFDQALRVQEEMITLRSDTVAGWKCLLPLDENKLIAAPIFADTVQSGESCTLLMDNGKARIEPEIAFVLGKDLPARVTDYTEAEINDAVKSCHMALELMQVRFRDHPEVTFFEKLADGMLNQGLYLGPEINKEKAYAASEININVDQATSKQQFDGVHPNKSTYKPLHWMINFMTKRGISFKAGEAFITGSFAGIVVVEFNEVTTISYEGLGEYQVTFIDG